MVISWNQRPFTKVLTVERTLPLGPQRPLLTPATSAEMPAPLSFPGLSPFQREASHKVFICRHSNRPKLHFRWGKQRLPSLPPEVDAPSISILLREGRTWFHVSGSYRALRHSGILRAHWLLRNWLKSYRATKPSRRLSKCGRGRSPNHLPY